MSKTNAKGNGNSTPPHGVTTIDSLHEVPLEERFENHFEGPNFTASVIDAQGVDGPAVAPDSKRSRRGRRLLFLGALLFVVIAVCGSAIYLMSSSKGRTTIQMLVRDRRPRETEKQKQNATSPDAITAEAIAEARRAAGADTPAPSSSVSSAPSIGSTTPTTVPAISKPGPNIAGTVTGPVTGDGSYKEEIAGPAITSSPTGTVNSTGTSPNSRTTTIKGRASQRNAEHSIRLDVAQPKTAPSLPVPAPLPEIALRAERPPVKTQERIAAMKSTKEAMPKAGLEVALPSFGSMLPVKTLGALLTLRTGALTRLELTRDVKGEGWSMQRGTTLVGSVRGSQNDRAYVSLIGFIDPESHRLVKLSGDVLGGDGGSGLRGHKRKVGNAWSRVLGGMAGAGANLAGQIVQGLGNRTVVVTDSYGRVFNPVSNEVNGLVSGRARREFVEVAAGSTGYVMVTGLPHEMKGVDAQPDPITDFDEEMATGLTEQELADLMANGTSEDIRSAMPRMTPQMRAIAQAVLEQE